MTAEGGARTTRLAYALAVFLSAALLFVVEPMVGKMLLPILGGAPAVWTTCLLFFQVALLLGYAYAHLLPRLGTRHVGVHLLLLVLAAAVLPPALRGPVSAPEASPVAWLLAALVATVGAPFVLIAATGPLLQRWFSELDHPDAADPYFLYAASNLGSFAGLLVYPFVLEPLVTLPVQRLVWSGAYLLLVVAIVLAARLLRGAGPRTRAGGPATAPWADAAADTAPAWRWLLLAAVPSSLLLAVTTHVTTDLAPVPLLWVLPLALYLLSFVATFARKPWISPAAAQRWLPLGLLVCLAGQLWAAGGPLWLMLLLDYALLSFAALLCHGELARLRPPAGRLTEFYLWLALGGAVGGAFNTLVAPHAFRSVAEYPLAIAAAAILVRWSPPGGGVPALGAIVAGVLALGAGLGRAATWLATDRVIPRAPGTAVLVNALALAAVLGAVLAWRRRVALLVPIGVALVLGTASLGELQRPGVLLRARDFFGIYRVQDTRQGFRVFFHGTTLHGLQPVAVRRRRWPTSYYHPEGPFGDVLAGVAPARPGRRVGVVGLGIGGAAAYAGPDESWTFYEIDPLVVRIARDTAYFTYLADAMSPPRVVPGDGRLSLSRDPTARFDVLVIDAFNSDAPPIHLLTREALTLYLGRLAPGGLLMLNITNRYLDFDPVVAALAADAGIEARVRDHAATREEERRGAYSSTWAVLARRAEDLGALASDPEWRRPRSAPGALWSDDFSNVVRRLR